MNDSRTRGSKARGKPGTAIRSEDNSPIPELVVVERQKISPTIKLIILLSAGYLGIVDILYTTGMWDFKDDDWDIAAKVISVVCAIIIFISMKLVDELTSKK